MHQTYSVGRPGHWREEDDPEISAVIFLVLLIKVIVNMEGGRSGALGGDFSYSFLRVSFSSNGYQCQRVEWMEASFQ